MGDNQEVVNPCYQMENYVAKMMNLVERLYSNLKLKDQALSLNSYP